MKEVQKEHAIRQAGGTAQSLRTMDQKTQTLPKKQYNNKNIHNNICSFRNAII